MPSIAMSPRLGGTGQSTVNPDWALSKGNTGLVKAGSQSNYRRPWFSRAPSAHMRGEPAPLSAVDRRPHPQPEPHPFGYVRRHFSREYTRPVDSMTWQGGVLTYNPIGAGVVFTNKLNVLARAVGDYVNGAIFWNSTPINFARQPVTGALLNPAQVMGVLGRGTLGAISAEQYSVMTGSL